MQHGPLADPVGHDRGVVVNHHGLGDATQALQAPHDRLQHVRHGLGQAVDHRVAAECGKVVTQPYALRVAPLPTGIRMAGSHQSPWANSPGR